RRWRWRRRRRREEVRRRHERRSETLWREALGPEGPARRRPGARPADRQRAQHPHLHAEEGREDHQEGAGKRDRQRRAQQRRGHRRAEDHQHLRRERPGVEALPGAREGPRQPHHQADLPRVPHGRRREKGLAMGQKINPTGFRLSVNRNWASKWFANTKNFPGMLAEDIKVREYLKKKLSHAAVGKVVIERPSKNARITIYSARPGVVI